MDHADTVIFACSSLKEYIAAAQQKSRHFISGRFSG